MNADNTLTIVLPLCMEDPFLQDKIRWAATQADDIACVFLAQDEPLPDLVVQALPRSAVCIPQTAHNECATTYLRMAMPQVKGRAVIVFDRHTQCNPGILANMRNLAPALEEKTWLSGETLIKPHNRWLPLTADEKDDQDFAHFAATRPLSGGILFQTDFVRRCLNRPSKENIWDDLALQWHLFCHPDTGSHTTEVFALRRTTPPALQLPQGTPEQRIEEAIQLLKACDDPREVCAFLELWLPQIIKEGDAWEAKAQLLELLHDVQAEYAMDTERVRELALYADAMGRIAGGLPSSPAENTLLLYLTKTTATIQHFLPGSDDNLQRYLASALKLVALYEKRLEHPALLRCEKFLLAFHELVQKTNEKLEQQRFNCKEAKTVLPQYNSNLMQT